MKIKIFLTAALFIGVCGFSFSQDYDAPIEVVEKKMSSNVRQGIDRLDGIAFEYHFVIDSKHHEITDDYFLIKLSGLINNTFIQSSSAGKHVNSDESIIIIKSDQEIHTPDIKELISQSGYKVIRYNSIYTLKN